MEREAASRRSSALAPAWHGSQDLCSAFVAAVIQVDELECSDVVQPTSPMRPSIGAWNEVGATVNLLLVA
jgi:hypothetical protein